MAEYLSPEWFAEMANAAASHASGSASDRAVALRESVTGTPFGDVSYVMTIGDEITIDLDAGTSSDVTFSQDYATAAALHRGELTTQEAFFAGRVRVSGHLNTLLENADALQGVSETFAEVRKATTYQR